jgi:hypothetical protein
MIINIEIWGRGEKLATAYLGRSAPVAYVADCGFKNSVLGSTVTGRLSHLRPL